MSERGVDIGAQMLTDGGKPTEEGACNLGGAPLQLAIAVAVLVIKTFLLVFLCRAFRFDWQTSMRTGFALSQVGEFSFVLFTASSAAGLLSSRSVTLGYLVISITMIATPVMIKLGDHIARRMKQAQVAVHSRTGAAARLGRPVTT